SALSPPSLPDALPILEHEVGALDAAPGGIGPVETLGEKDRRRGVHAVGLPERTGIRAFRAAIEPQSIALALANAGQADAVIVPRSEEHRSELQSLRHL